MKIEEAINHFKWKFTQSNTKVSKKDKSSLNTIIRALNEQSDNKLNDNLNFCKLLMFTFRELCLQNAIKNNYEFYRIRVNLFKVKRLFKIRCKFSY